MPLVEREELAWGGSHSGWDQLCKLFMGRRGRGWVWQLRQLLPPSPHPLRAGAGYPMRGGRWAGPSNSENGSEALAGVFEIFIFILSQSQSQVGLRPRRPTQHGRKGAHPHTLPKVNVGATRPAHGRSKSDFEPRPFYFKNCVNFFS